MHLQNKIAIVTGASSGVGHATSLALAREGVHVAIAARTEDKLTALAEKIRALGREALVVPTDVTDECQVNALVDHTLQRWGQIDIVFANAGAYVRCPVRDVTLDAMEQAFAVNTMGAIALVQRALPHMLARHSGHIALMTSLDALTPIPPDAPYVASKAALAGYGQCLRQELRGSGISVTIIYPGRIDTPLIDHLEMPLISAKLSPERVARAIVRGIIRRHARIVLPTQGRLLEVVNLISPRLYDWLVQRLRLAGWPSR
jgi:short-subunit dehydrogenase